MTRATLAWALVVAACSLPGCLGGSDIDLPGVRTHTTVDTAFGCPSLRAAADGCVIVRAQDVDSGCAPEAPGYAQCDAVVTWSATVRGLEPGERLLTSVNGTEGPACEPVPPAACRVAGTLAWRQSFDGPGESAWWNVTLRAWLAGAPDDAWFELRLAMQVRTQGASATDV